MSVVMQRELGYIGYNSRKSPPPPILVYFGRISSRFISVFRSKGAYNYATPAFRRISVVFRCISVYSGVGLFQCISAFRHATPTSHLGVFRYLGMQHPHSGVFRYVYGPFAMGLTQKQDLDSYLSNDDIDHSRGGSIGRGDQGQSSRDTHSQSKCVFQFIYNANKLDFI